MAFARIILNILQGFVIILLAPGFIGLLEFLKASFVQRYRHPITILHPYWDILENLKFPAVHSSSSSWFFAYTPYVLMGIYGSLAFMVPVFLQDSLLVVDLVQIISILGLGRFFISLAGLDAFSPFAWLGSTREMFYQFSTEIVFAFFLATSAVIWDSSNIQVLIWNRVISNNFMGPPEPTIILLALSFIVITLLELGRLPIDNQETHYELTMGHKAIELEFSGRDLATVELAEEIKFAFFITLFANLFLPYGLAYTSSLNWSSLLLTFTALLVFSLKVAALIIALAVWETIESKMRLREVPQFSLWGVAFSILAFILFASGVQ